MLAVPRLSERVPKMQLCGALVGILLLARPALAGQLSMRFAGGSSEITLAQNETATIEIVWDGGPLDGGKTPRRMTGTDLRFDVVVDSNAETPPNPGYGDQGPPGFPASSDFLVSQASTPIANWSAGATVLGTFNRNGFYLSAGDPQGASGPTGDTPPIVIVSFVIRKTSASPGDTYVSFAQLGFVPTAYNGPQVWGAAWQYEVNDPLEFDLGQGNPGDGAPRWDPFHCLEVFQPLIIHSAQASPIVDCNLNGIRDEFEMPCYDCNENGTLDGCETSQDCNVNSVPDECDILTGYSLDCNTNSSPDECDLQLGEIGIAWDGTGGTWSQAENWCPDQVPNNETNREYYATITGTASEVTLDTSPTIDELSILDGAALEVNSFSGALVRSIAVENPIQNDGFIRAREGRRLLLDASDITQSASGIIEAVGLPGESSRIQILGRRVVGGTVRTEGDAKIELLGGAVLENVIVEGDLGRTNSPPLSTVVVPNQQSGNLAGIITNEARIEIDAVTYTTSLKPGPSGATLTGSGSIALRSPDSAPLAELGAAALSLTNAEGHRIEGSGILLGIFRNDGTVDANVGGSELIVDESGQKTLGTSGVYRASAGGILEIHKRINHPPLDSPHGRIEARDAGIVRLRHPKGDPIVVRCETAVAHSHGAIELADESRLELTGTVMLDSAGVLRAAEGVAAPSGAVIAAGLSMIGGGSQLVLSGEMSADIRGAVVISANEAAPAFLRLSDGASMIVDASLSLVGAVDAIVQQSTTFRLAGDFENHSTQPLTFDWRSLALDGTGTQSIEAAGEDRGPYTIGLDANFAIGVLTLETGSSVHIVDAFDNQQDGGAACEEALYVDSLIVNIGATLTTGGCRVYYRDVTNFGTIPGLGSDVVPVTGIPGDCDGDGDLQLDDWSQFSGCLTGPTSAMGEGCLCADLDFDERVDLLDVAGIQASFDP